MLIITAGSTTRAMLFLSTVGISVFGIQGHYESPYGSHASHLYRTWSHWTEWSSCSRSCGTGIRARTRTCRLRLASRTHFSSQGNCAGPTTEYDLCKTQRCADDSDFRLYQCSQHNGKPRGGHAVREWIPYVNYKRPCELQCMSSDRSLLYSFGKAIDGTACTAHGVQKGSICVNGRCSNVDCAGQLGTDNEVDVCGICRGDNSTCVHHRNTYWSRERKRRNTSSDQVTQDVYDYDVIAEIPASATHISIREGSVNNFLALMDETGRFILNGNWKIGSPGQFVTEYGSEVTYKRSTEGQESLYVDGPTKGNLLILVIGSGDIPTVDYEYWISSLHPPKTKNYLLNYYKLYYNLVPKVRHEKNLEQKVTYRDVNSLEPKDPDSVKIIQGYRSYYHRNEPNKPENNKERYVLDTSPKDLTQIGGPDDTIQAAAKLPSPNSTPRTPVTLTEEQTIFNRQEYEVRTSDATRRELNSGGATKNRQPINVERIQHAEKLSRNGTLAFSRRFQEKAVVIPFSGNFTRKTSKEPPQQQETSTNTPANLKKLSSLKQKKEQKFKKRKRRQKGTAASCPPCLRVKQQRKNFCRSDFVLRIVVLSVDVQTDSIRYEVKVIQSYRNTVPILPMEYIWTSELCRCPRLHINQEYIIMGLLDSSRRESRLLVDENSYTRKYNRKRARTMQKLVRDKNSKCRKFT